jgi:2-alkenal reductase
MSGYVKEKGIVIPMRISRLGLTVLVVVILCTGMVLGSVVTLVPLRVQGQGAGVVDDEATLLEHVYAQASPSVVSIVVRVPADSTLNELLPYIDPDNSGTATPEPSYRYAQASGFVYDDKGDIVTNAHVVDQADRISITFSDGLTFPATVVGIAPDADLAVVKVSDSRATMIPLPLADSDQVKVGSRAIAIGNPFGLNGSMTQGIISAIKRTLPQSQFRIPDILQTDAAINPGNSGGPLLNGDGALIGINTAIRSRVMQSAGVGFAIPSNIVKLMADQLIANGKVEHSYLGVIGSTLTADVDELLGLDITFRGVLVSEVPAGGPAAKAGVRGSTKEAELDGLPVSIGGDIIIAIDDQPLKYFEDMLGYLFTKTKPGQVVKLTVYRDGKNIDLQVTLTARPATNN